jgi:ABC-type phosphate transport system substrate-binding protein
LEAIPVARDALAFVVNSDLEVDALSQAQIKQIYEGRNGQPITWAELGFTVDDSLEAIPISRNPTDSGTARYFFLEFIRDPDFSLLQPPNSVIQLVQTVGTGGESEQGIDRVRTSPGSIFYATATELFGQPGLKPIALRSAAENQDQSLLPYNDPNFAPLVNCVNPEQRLTSAPINPDYSLTREMYVVVKNYPEDAELPSEQQNHERVGNSYACMLLSDEGQQLLQTTGYFPLSLEQRNQSRQTANCDEFLVEESTT